MDKITKEEVQKIAKMTRLEVSDNDIDSITHQLSAVLEYAQRVQYIAKEVDIPSNKNINHDREDVVIQGDTAKIIAQAPQSDDNYFVVPKIIES